MAAHIDIREFFVEGSDQKKSHCLLHITEPSTSDEVEKGYFFAIAEIERSNLKVIELIQKMIDDIESGYYATDDEEGKNAFELTLEYVNRRTEKILQETKGDVHCMVGVVRGTTLSFAMRGSIHSLVFFHRAGKVQAMNIADEIEDEHDAQEQFFSAVIEGQLNPNDQLFVGTPYLTEHFSYDRIQKIVTSRTARQATDHMERVLQDLSEAISFAGVLVTVVSKKHAPKTGKQPASSKQGSAASLNRLIEAERKTAETLAPPITKQIKKYMQTRFQGTESKETKARTSRSQAKKQRGKVETNYRYREPQADQTLLNRILIGIGRALVTIGLVLIDVLRKAVGMIGKAAVVLIILVTNKNNGRQDMLIRVKDSFDKKKRQIDSLPFMSKMLFFVAIAFALIFVSSIAILKVQRDREAKLVAFNQTIQLAEQKIDDAEASRIYNDTERAFDLLTEARALVVSAGEPKGNQIETIKSLSDRMDAMFLTLRKMEVVNPTLLADLSSFVPGALFSEIARIDNTIIAFGPDADVSVRYSIPGKTISTKAHDTIPSLFAADTPKEDDMVLFLAGDDGLAQYDTDAEVIVKKDISFPNPDAALSDFAIYNLRVYTLDPVNNQIYRHSKIQTGYDQGTAWITDSTDISQGVSIAIDGDVYVLQSDGRITRFVSGSRDPFDVSALDPVFENPTDIWTYSSVANLYVLEPNNKRIVVLTKEGRVVKQLTSDNWVSPTGMIIDEENDIGFVLDDNKLYTFSLGL